MNGYLSMRFQDKHYDVPVTKLSEAAATFRLRLEANSPAGQKGAEIDAPRYAFWPTVATAHSPGEAQSGEYMHHVAEVAAPLPAVG